MTIPAVLVVAEISVATKLALKIPVAWIPKLAGPLVLVNTLVRSLKTALIKTLKLTAPVFLEPVPVQAVTMALSVLAKMLATVMLVVGKAVQFPVDAVTRPVQLAIHPVATPVKPFFDAVAFVIEPRHHLAFFMHQALRQLAVARSLGPLNHCIQTMADAVALFIEKPVNLPALFVHKAVNAIAFLIQAVLDAVPFLVKIIFGYGSRRFDSPGRNRTSGKQKAQNRDGGCSHDVSP